MEPLGSRASLIGLSIIFFLSASLGIQGYNNRYSNPNNGRGGGYDVVPGNQNHYIQANQQQYNQKSTGYGYYVDDGVRESEISCAPPKVNDEEAQMEIDGCRLNGNNNGYNNCQNGNSRIAAGKKGVMICARGRRVLKLTTTCRGGSWNPPMPENCDNLFALLPKKNGDNREEELESRRPCPKLVLKLSPAFILSCHIPTDNNTLPVTSNCLEELTKGIPSGGKISLTCRPPLLPTHPQEILCQDGKWEGNLKEISCHGSKVVTHGSTIPSTNEKINLPKPLDPNKRPASPVTPHIPKTEEQRTTQVSKEQKVPSDDGRTHVSSPSTSPTTTSRTTISTTPRPNISMRCPPLKPRSFGVLLSCTFSGTEGVEQNNCNSTYLPPGTEAQYSCKMYYESNAALPTLYRKCKEDGTWSGSSDFSCNVQCGRENIVKVPFITHSLPTLRGQWPWHAALFRSSSRQKDKWEYICGGTLLTTKALITAGHCVTLLQTSQILETSELRVHLGKYKREENDDYVQIEEIAEIVLHQDYNPYNYDSDLALLILEKGVTIGHFVRPICFITTSDSVLEDLQLADNSIGTVVGWGYDENNTLGDDLRMARLRVVGTRECAKSMIGSSLTQLNTRSTTFCAGYNNGTNVCNGDSGSGMYFSTKDSDNVKWYIQGLVSVGVANDNGRCKPEQFSVFTRLGRYADFITKTLSEYDAV